MGADSGVAIIGEFTHMLCLWTKIFGDRLTFSNISSRTFRQIYRLQNRFSCRKSRISFYNAYLALFVRMDDTITRTLNASVGIVIY